MVSAPPSSPSGPLQVIQTGPDSLLVQWGPPDGDGGSSLLSYDVMIKDSERSVWMEVARVHVTEYWTQIKDLHENRSYDIRVFAKNGVGYSLPLETEDPIKVIHPAGVVVPPSPPIGPMKLNHITDKSIEVSWKPPKNLGGSNITMYIIETRRVSDPKTVHDVEVVDPPNTVGVLGGLETGETFTIRVYAENSAGLSNPLINSSPIRISRHTYRPSSPGKPNVIMWDDVSSTVNEKYNQYLGDSVILTWEAPYHEGGTPLYTYIVEKCEKETSNSDCWERVSIVPIKDEMFAIANLPEGGVFCFRILAENGMGVSEPSTPSKPYKIPYRKKIIQPYFTKKPKSVTAIDGEKVQFTTELIGSPSPKVTWYINNTEVENSEDIFVSCEDGKHTLIINSVGESHKGTIKICASNPLCTVSATAKLQINRFY